MPNIFPTSDRHRICVLAYDRLCTFEFASAVEILSDRSDQFGTNWYDLSIGSLERGRLSGKGGVTIAATDGREAIARADTIVVPGWRMGGVPPSITRGLRAAHERGARIASICTGAFVLAASGLLDGRRATTHWKYAATLAADYPAIEVDASVLYIDDGNVVTSAGSVAGIDMLLHLIRSDFGPNTANGVARMMVTQPHRDGGQAQYYERPVAELAGSGLDRVLDHLRRTPEADHNVANLASIAALSPRTFFRRFRAATGKTPYDWLVHERVRRAKDLLEGSDLSIDEVAHRAGFGAADTLRHHFRQVTGTTPSTFRATFRPSCDAEQSAARRQYMRVDA